MCRICVLNDDEHKKIDNIFAIKDIFANNKDFNNKIKNENQKLLNKKQVLENRINFNEFLLKEYDNYFYLFEDPSLNYKNQNDIKNNINNSMYIIDSNIFKNINNNSIPNNINNSISRSSSISNINNEEINNTNIIYMEGYLKNDKNSSNIKDGQTFQNETNGTVILCDDLNNLKLLLKYLSKNNSKSKFFLIVNGGSSKETIDFIKNNNYNTLFINAFIYTTNRNKYLDILNNNSDLVKDIYTHSKYIVEYINQNSKNLNINNEKYYINPIININSYKNNNKYKYFNLHQELSKYYGNEFENVFNDNFQLICNFIRNGDFQKNIKDNLIKSFNIFSELPKQNYEKIITCYLNDTNFSRILNLILDKKDLSLYKNIGYFAGNLMHSIVQYGKKWKKGINKQKIFYLGMRLNIIQLMEFLKNKYSKITFPYFLSLTSNKNFAEDISSRNVPFINRKNKDLYSVIMTINYNYQEGYEPSIFELKDLSNFPDEEEHILLPFTFMKLNNVKIDSNNYNADFELTIIGKKEILEYKIKENMIIEYDKLNKIMVPKYIIDNNNN